MKMLRRNVLIDTGETIGAWKSDIIERAPEYERINSIGRILSVGPQCRILKKKDEGRQVVVGLIRDGERKISPTHSEQLGLKKHWHLIAHEEKVMCALDQ